ncbi:PadR family transcriptional regulator [Nocardioides sp. Kera G14]|uniref:PadR family transcriptional regulator n=1 Tax=Nocardioides sp. Kera G14 TaxID=2884264 RepID=UPI001D1116D2|nr:PadR family transcriptional regulator [Nocardioides sp. Kera G14]UDY24739.1 PadR family transcriptional regulator [Nocardioides sp. Kera G14]
MSVRNGLLALLSEQPMYGAQLRTEFESRTGDTWPLNIGQVYSTLQRLERDGLVRHGVDGAGDPKTIPYSLTDAGQAEVAQWWDTALPTTPDPRDELTIKLALAVTVPGVDVRDLVQRQRAAAMAHLQELTRAKRAGNDSTLAAELVLERRIFDAEALVRWLDHIEGRLAMNKESAR